MYKNINNLSVLFKNYLQLHDIFTTDQYIPNKATPPQ